VTSVIVHYQELGLKGRNRPWFINTLVRTLRDALRDIHVTEVRPIMGRIEVRLRDDGQWPEVAGRLRWIPGIANFSRATHVDADLEQIAGHVAASVAGCSPCTFRVSARRADKRFPVPSPDMERVIGRRVQDVTGWRVDLTRPERTIFVEVVTNDAFFYFDKERGAGGLPVGSGGRVMTLLSGGIDSPVAGWRLIRRGCRTSFVHFHSHPILSRTSQDKARSLVEQLTRGQLHSRLFLVPFAPIQQRIVIGVPPALRVLIYRRFMLRIAERLAKRTGAQALVTGDVVGQVASQTIENLAVVGAAATMPLLRPLIGFDKDEITAEAQRLGTYDISIVPDDDCCSLFAAKFPSTRASREEADAAETDLSIEQWVDEAAAAAVVEDFRFPMVKSARQETTRT